MVVLCFIHSRACSVALALAFCSVFAWQGWRRRVSGKLIALIEQAQAEGGDSSGFDDSRCAKSRI
jgi:hypothetical protein